MDTSSSQNIFNNDLISDSSDSSSKRYSNSDSNVLFTEFDSETDDEPDSPSANQISN